ncbi:MAG: hypothetical protein ACOH1V_02380 [Stenotrophomonas sp.]
MTQVAEQSDIGCFLREFFAAVLIAGALLLVGSAVIDRLRMEEDSDNVTGTAFDIEPAQGGEADGGQVLHAGMVRVSTSREYVRGGLQ